MIILPIGHEDLTLSKLPFATFVLMAICIAATLIGGSTVSKGIEQETISLNKTISFYAANDYLELEPAIVGALPRGERTLYEHRQEWLDWLTAAPDEVADFVATTPVEKRKKDVVSILDSTGEVVQVDQEEGPPRTLEDKELTSLKAEFLGRVAAIDPQRKYDQQQRLDDLVSAYTAAVERSPARRFAYVPSSSSPIGLVTHIFIHAGVLQMVINLVFLWIVAAKLEDIWGRLLFVAAFVVFGVIGALTHGLVNPDSTVPLVGASGSVAGLMGAYVVRLARSKVKFVYLYMILKPKYGSFDAPAFLIPPLFFFATLIVALFTDFSAINHWSYLGGIVAGVVLALAFKLTDFERRVLGRESEAQTDPEAAPLVAFQRPTTGRAEPADTAPTGLTLTEATIDTLAEDRLSCAMEGNASFEITREQVTLLAAAQVGQIAGPLAERWFRSTEPRTGPTILLALIVGRAEGPRTAPTSGYVIDAAKLRYNRLFDQPLATPRDNFFALLKKVIALFPAARFVGDRERLAAGELPTYLDLNELEARLLKATRRPTGST